MAERTDTMPITGILGKAPAAKHLSAPKGTTARNNLYNVLKLMRKHKVNPGRHHIIIDTGSGHKVPNFAINACPTITAVRGASRAYWDTRFNRILTVKDPNNVR